MTLSAGPARPKPAAAVVKLFDDLYTPTHNVSDSKFMAVRECVCCVFRRRWQQQAGGGHRQRVYSIDASVDDTDALDRVYAPGSMNGTPAFMLHMHTRSMALQPQTTKKTPDDPTQNS